MARLVPSPARSEGADAAIPAAKSKMRMKAERNIAAILASNRIFVNSKEAARGRPLMRHEDGKALDIEEENWHNDVVQFRPSASRSHGT